MSKIGYIFLLIVMNSFILKAQDDFHTIDSLETIIRTQTGYERAISQRTLSLIYYNKTFYEKSLKHAIESLNFFEEKNLDSNAMYLHNTIGTIYERTKQFGRAEEHYLIALKGFKKFHVDKGVLMINLNLGVLFCNNSDFIKSEKHTLSAIKKAKEIKDTFSLIISYNNLSFSYFLNDQNDQSITAIDSGLFYVRLCPKTDEFLKRKYSLKVNLAENYVKLEKFNEALIVLDELLKHEQSLSLRETRDVYSMYSITCEKLQLYEKAYSYLKKERYFSDSLSEAINSELLMELTIKNEIEYKEQENELKLKKNELKLSAQKHLNNILGLSLVFLIITIIVIVIFYVKTKTKNKQLVESNLKMLESEDNILPQIKIKTSKKTIDIPEDKKLTLINNLNKAFKYDEIFKDNTLTVNSLAKKLNTNRNYLSIVIKELCPSGFLDFVNEYRIRKSWTLLSNPKYFHLTIDYISKEVGFKSQPTFNKAFKKFTGVTPSFYLKEAKIQKKSH